MAQIAGEGNFQGTVCSWSVLNGQKITADEEEEEESIIVVSCWAGHLNVECPIRGHFGLNTWVSYMTRDTQNWAEASSPDGIVEAKKKQVEFSHFSLSLYLIPLSLRQFFFSLEYFCTTPYLFFFF